MEDNRGNSIKRQPLCYASQPFGSAEPTVLVRYLHSAVQEARFDIDETTVKAFNGQYIRTPNGGGALLADSHIMIEYGIYDVIKVAISDSENNLYASPDSGSRNITFNSKTPVPFYMIIDSYDTCFIETSSFQFLKPQNATDPLIYEQTPIDTALYQYRFTAPTDGADYWTLFSPSLNSYIGLDTTTSSNILRAGYENTKGANTHLQLITL